MQFSSWKEWIKKYLKNDNNYNNNKNEKPEEEEHVSLCVVKMLSTFDYVMLSYAENKFVAETQ
jgi:hypothetical protein